MKGKSLLLDATAQSFLCCDWQMNTAPTFDGRGKQEVSL